MDEKEENPHILPMVCSVTLFENYLTASTFHQILNCFNQICLGLQLDPLDYQMFYIRLKHKLTNWKAQKLWTLLDKRASQKEYRKQKACQNMRVLIIGAGPCGLRMAIECALLGCKVVVLEKRDRFSRNNVLHIWPFVIQDLKNLGAKLFYPKFCAGSIDHISIRQLQCILLKIALLLGVEVHENVSFVELVEPQTNENGEKLGWRAKVAPETHYLSEYEFDALIGADGKRNTVPGFRRKEFRGKLAIAITANFINRHTEAEERVQEISGVAFIFNQQFFKDMRERTGIDLENIVYYKDETHYFVMTAKKQSLLEKNVIVNDYDDISLLLHPDNIDQGALMTYAREAADFATDGKLPHLEFAFNHHALPDVAMFDFTSLFSAENSCRLFERGNCRLLVSIVGDSLHEPFWPTGSGCARGFLSVFDSAWMLKNYCSSKCTPLEVLATRESTYRLLAQTTTENLTKNIQSYTIDPKSRYPRLDFTILPNQVRSLIDTDNWALLDETATNGQSVNSTAETRRVSSTLPRRTLYDHTSTYARHQQLIRWYQQIVQPFRLRVDNLTQSFRSGMVLNAVLHRFRPETTPDLTKLRVSDVTNNCQRAYDLIRSEFGVDPPLSVCDRNLMYEYLYAVYEALKKESPTVIVPSSMVVVGASLKRKSPDDATETKTFLTSSSSKKYDGETEEKMKERHRRRLERLETASSAGQQQNGGASAPSAPKYPSKRPTCVEKLSQDRLKDFEKMFLETLSLRKREIRQKKPLLKTRKLEQREIDEMEEKLKLTAMGHLLAQSRPPVEPTLSTHDAKIIEVKTAALKQKAERGFQEEDVGGRFGEFDKRLTDLDRKLRLPNRCGAVGVGELLQQHNENIAALKKKPPVPLPNETPPPKTPTPVPEPMSNHQQIQNNQNHPSCFFCGKRVYLAEKLTVEGVSCHNACFRCVFCDAKLRLNAYGMERLDVDGDGRYTRQFFCSQHLAVGLAEKIARIKSKKRQSSTTTVVAPPPVPVRGRASIEIDLPDNKTALNQGIIDFKPLPTNATTKRILTPLMQNNDENLPTSSSLAQQILNSSFSSNADGAKDTPERAEFEVSFRGVGGVSSLINSRENLLTSTNEFETNDVIVDADELMNNLKTNMETDEFIIPDIDEDELEEEVLYHNLGLPPSIENIHATTTERFINEIEIDHVSDDDGSMDESDEDSSDLSAAEETVLANFCLSKTATLPSELTYEEAAMLAQTLKERKRDESPLSLVENDDDDDGNSNDESDTTEDDDDDAGESTNSDDFGGTVVQEPKKKLVFTPPSTSKINDAIFFKVPPTPPALKPPKKVLYLHTGDEATTTTNLKSPLTATGGDAFFPPDSPLRVAKMQEYEKLKEESRAKAKLKSDEELRISLNYAKSPIVDFRQSLMNSSPNIRNKSASQEVLPSPTKETSASIEQLTKRRANSEEAQHIYSIERPTSIGFVGNLSPAVGTPSSDVPSSTSTATNSASTTKRPSIFSRLFGGVSSSPASTKSKETPLESPTNGPPPAAADSPLANVNVVSESARETNLLDKFRLRKYNRNKSRASSSPPKDRQQEQATTSTPAAKIQQNTAKENSSTKEQRPTTFIGVAPKATVDEMELSDSTPESPPIRSKSKSSVIEAPSPPMTTKPSMMEPSMKLSTYSSLSTATTVPGSMSLASLQSGDSKANDRHIRQIQKAAAKLARQQEQKRAHRAQEIQRSLQEIDVKRQQIDIDGSDIEQRLNKDPKNKDLLQQWLDLVDEKERLERQQTTLNLSVQDLELENEHCQLQQEMRERTNVATSEKTSKSLQEEKRILERCLDIVSRRDKIVTKLEEERVKEQVQQRNRVLNKNSFNYRDFEPVFVATVDGGQSGTIVQEGKYKSALHSLV